MPKRPMANDESVAGPSKVAKIEQEMVVEIGTENEESGEEDDEETGDDQAAKQIKENLSIDDPMERTFDNGATPAQIHEVFMDAIVDDPVMLDVYQQPDMREIIGRVRPDFPYPNVRDLVLKRFQEYEKRLKSMLDGMGTFFSVYLSNVEFHNITFALVEAAYFGDYGNRKTIALGCIPYSCSSKLHEDILELIYKYNIERRCYNICGSTVEFQDVIDNILGRLPTRNNRRLPEYLSSYKKFTELDIEELNRSIVTCLQMVANELELKSGEIHNTDHELATIMDQMEVIQSDQTRLETRIREIRREPELISCYLSSRSQLDLLCVYELRKLRKDINELIAHLKNYNESKYEEPIISSDNENQDNSAVLVHSNLNGTNGLIHCRKVLESCANVLRNDVADLRQWANDYWNDNPTTRVVRNFNTFVERVTSRIEEDENLWIQVFLIKQWQLVVPATPAPSPPSP